MYLFSGYAGIDMRYCYGLTRIPIIPRVTPIVLNILKHPGSIPDRLGSPRSCHGLVKDRQGFVTVSLRFFTDHPGLTIRGDPASEPGQWDFGFSLPCHFSVLCFIRRIINIL